MFSAMITAPSTMMPKSIAPTESKPMGMPVTYISSKATSSAKGIVRATRRGHRRPSQEQQQHEHHQGDAQQHAVRHGVQRALDEERAIVERLHADALGQDRGVQLLDGLLDAVEHLRGVLAAAHDHDALDRFVAVVLAENAGGRRIVQPHRGDVADVDGRAADRLDEDRADLRRVLHRALAADHERHAAARHDAAAGAGVVALDGVGDVAQRQAVALAVGPG